MNLPSYKHFITAFLHTFHVKLMTHNSERQILPPSLCLRSSVRWRSRRSKQVADCQQSKECRASSATLSKVNPLPKLPSNTPPDGPSDSPVLPSSLLAR